MEPEEGGKADKGGFSLMRRASSFEHAGRGIWIFLRGTHNSWIHIACFVAAVALSAYLRISPAEWLAVILASGLVFVSEAFNTAMEVDMDLTSPGYHPYARDTKDIASGAVLIAALTAAGVAAVIFLPKLYALL